MFDDILLPKFLFLMFSAFRILKKYIFIFVIICLIVECILSSGGKWWSCDGSFYSGDGSTWTFSVLYKVLNQEDCVECIVQCTWNIKFFVQPPWKLFWSHLAICVAPFWDTCKYWLPMMIAMQCLKGNFG